MNIICLARVVFRNISETEEVLQLRTKHLYFASGNTTNPSGSAENEQHELHAIAQFYTTLD